MSKEKCLVIETHSDDSCISSAGFIRKYKDKYEFYFLLLAVSDINFYHAGLVDINTRMKEYSSYVSSIEGNWLYDLDKSKYTPFDFESRMDRIEYKKVVNIIENSLFELKPDLLMFQGRSIHQDHRVTHDAVFTALRPCGRFYPNLIYITENPTHSHHDESYNTLKPNVYCDLTEEDINSKIELFKRSFPSQARSADNYLSNEGIKDWARYRGIEARCMYAEAFYQVSGRI